MLYLLSDLFDMLPAHANLNVQMTVSVKAHSAAVENAKNDGDVTDLAPPASENVDAPKVIDTSNEHSKIPDL
jgi:hypothetical protein